MNDSQRVPHNQQEMRYRFIKTSSIRNAVIIALLITLFVGFSLYWNITELRQEKIDLALVEARAYLNKDTAFRRWASRHGGVYVKIDQRTPPNPYLSHVANRDVITTEGIKLTLMNPAYMMRQMTQEFDESYGIKGKLTGKKQLNPINKPDVWEFEALTKFEAGAKEVVQLSDIDGVAFLRFMKPMYMTKDCVKCHGLLGYKEGDLRGGTSISVPLEPYFTAAAKTSRTMRTSHAIVWLLAMLTIYLFTHFARERQRERTQLLQQLEHDSMHDALTNLPNRLLFTDRLDHALKLLSRDSNYHFAVCFLDLDRFKNLNDSYGHLIGDKLLVQVAERFREFIRPADTVARIGGDEFTFLLDDINGVNEAVFITERILGSLKTPFETEIGELYINASIGICLSSEHYTQSVDMLRDADIALYRAKEKGRGRIDMFNEDMHEAAQKVMNMENDLRYAMEKQQFELNFQPVVNISENRIIGLEALLRWRHPQQGYISPEEFIPVAEDTGLINEIGAWVMRRACLRVRDWNLTYANEKPFFVAVNLSAKQLIQTDIVDSISRILSETHFDPNLLHCEVTETAVITNREISAKIISELQSKGIEISVDDFGKGYSSLTYLHEFEFDTLKIDKDFVQSMGDGKKGLKLVKAMMLLARDFSMKVIAEGVEDNYQLRLLESMGCSLIQGYYYSKPRSVDDITALLQQGCHKDANKLLEPASVQELLNNSA